MDPTGSHRPDSSEEAMCLFSEYLAARDEDDGLVFDAWVRGHPGREAELRALHAAWARAAAALPSAPSTGGTPADPGASGDLSGAIGRGLEVLEELGKGGFGCVYRAHDPLLKREVALKVLGDDARLTPGARRRFLEEARALARIDHPNVVRILSVDAQGDEIRLVLELVKGQTLRDVVQRDGPLGWDEAARVGAEVCRALAALHAEGLVHLDVKAGNVMRAEGGRIVLLDFGLARAHAAADRAEAPIAGTPLSMAPEQLAGGPVDGRADLYALGVLLYWLVSRRFPHQAETFAELRRRVLETDPSRLVDVRPDTPPEFAAVVERALRRDPAERWATAGEMEAALRGLLAGAAEANGEHRARRVGRWGLAAAAVAAVAFGTVSLMRDGGALASDRFTVDAHLFARRDRTDVRLRDGDAVRLGDKLFLEVRAPEEFHLYVFNEDEAGNVFQLYPLADLGQTNPVPGGAVHRLPHDVAGEPKYWLVSMAGGGAEHILALASKGPSSLGEALCAEIPDAAAGGEVAVTYSEVRSSVFGRLRGVSSVVGPDPGDVTEAVDALSELFLRMEAEVGDDPSVELVHFELRHPA